MGVGEPRVWSERLNSLLVILLRRAHISWACYFQVSWSTHWAWWAASQVLAMTSSTVRTVPVLGGQVCGYVKEEAAVVEVT